MTNRLYAVVVGAGEPDSGVRLAELVAAFSMATNLSMGQPHLGARTRYRRPP